MAEGDLCDICIDKEGLWYYRGAEMTRRDIVRYFYQHLKQGQGGEYYIEIGADRCPVQVEDVPYIILSVSLEPHHGDKEGCLLAFLSDGTRERLDEARPLRVGKDHVLYGWVGGGRCEARFSRPAYYQLSRYIAFDPVRRTYWVQWGRHSIQIGAGREGKEGFDAH